MEGDDFAWPVKRSDADQPPAGHFPGVRQGPGAAVTQYAVRTTPGEGEAWGRG